ncbi:MAG: class I SAM-dependent methyltransferase [Phenylobacterium sp.]|uniref:class I SAM-dependent methyltransferase n=1 Tax=Phenylobacterium sp. TaxID=1871053 RepID=UPI0027210276|nr:class I SAM-dependent methyltransferase [Phenylobacterium sp.]MDO8901721.1 class I SAM-dependent methyltransferase [Phenylobacterium sp.]
MTSRRPSVAPSPGVMRTTGWADYGLLDSGDGKKLERYGPYTVVRPEPQCLWAPRLDPEVWAAADAVFDPSDEEDAGRWRFQGAPLEAWPMAWRQAKFNARFTAFRHLAFFPEQAANWEWLEARVRSQIQAQVEPPRVLNLFGYTGVASLVCAAAGAAVTHVDASKKAIAMARENAQLSDLADRPIRWICEDARRYVQREVRRGSRYEGIILDPPKYGRGPTGEVWRLFEDLPELSALCAELLSENASFLILNAYAARISGAALASLMAERLAERGGTIEWGELALAEESGEREIGLSFYARWAS